MTVTGDDLSFGALLRTLRRQQRLTQQGLAEAIGVHRRSLIRWEQGDSLPESKALVLELARRLKLDDQETRQLLEASLTARSPYFLVPLPRNPFFTGREAVLEVLHTQLGSTQTVAFTQSSALHGLGGVGKTQVALEYAYRHALEYSAVFWIGAETDAQIVAGYLRIAEVLQLPGQDVKDQQRMVAAVQNWLISHGQWLLIWDNMEDLALLDRFLPSVRSGAILLTTRNQALGTRTRGIDLFPMEQAEGKNFLLRRAKVLEPGATHEQMQQPVEWIATEYTAAEELVVIMGGLPLALDQAGAYIEETGCSLSDYLGYYGQQRAYLLARRGNQVQDHLHSVTTTFRLAMERVGQEQQRAADVLRVCALLHPEAIHEELFVQGAPYLGPALEALAADLIQFDQTLAVLRNFSLVQRQAETSTLSLHRLVQAVLRDQMSEQEQIMWLKRLSAALNALFPEDSSDARRWEPCERLLPHVLFVAAATPDYAGNWELAEVLCKAADYLHEHARYEQAEELYRRSVCLGELETGSEHPALARALDGLAFLLGEQGKYTQAESLGNRALRLREQLLGPEHPQVASSLNTMAILSADQGKHEQAEPLFLRALHIWEQSLGARHPQVATSLNRLALLYWRQEKYEQAEPLFLRTLHIWEQAFGPASIQVAPALNNLALLCWKQKRYEQAEALFLYALDIWEQAFGSEYPQLAYALTGLAILYAEQKRYEQAEPLFLRVLHIREQIWGAEHHQVAIALRNLGELSTEQGKYRQAEPLFQRVLHIEEQVWGPAHPQLVSHLDNLADLYVKQGKYTQAQALYQRGLLIWERNMGTNDPHEASPLNGLAHLFLKQGKTEQAESLYQQALRIQEEALGEHHPELAQTLHDLALFQLQQGKLSEAILFAERAFSIRSQILGAAHPKTITTQALKDQLFQLYSSLQSDPF